MKVQINKQEISVPEGITTLEELLKAENLAGAGTAVAIGGNVVRRADWGTYSLHDGLRITVISAVCGG